jgi:putative oxidoreductase
LGSRFRLTSDSFLSFTFLFSPMQTRNIIAWILQVLLAVMFIKAGFDKLSNLDGTMKMFGGLGLPSWFGGLIGAAELLGGIGLLVPRTVRLAALGLIIIMIGAVFMHATKIPGGIGGGTAAIGTLVALVVVYFLRRPTTVATDRMVA